MQHGILPLLKPQGLTSHDCVSRLRRMTGIKKIGHTGTLDPDVTGVLPLCFGQATRVAEYVLQMPKEYEGEMVLGRSTDTADASGETLEVKEVEKDSITAEQMKQAFSFFIGKIEQIPPMYSAVKVNGKRLYDLARQGKDVEREARIVHIYDLTMLDMLWKSGELKVSFRVTCSKGTYIRVLCEDIGKKLGYPAHMSKLVRTRSGPYEINQCVTLEEVEQEVEKGTWQQLLLPIDTALIHFPRIFVRENQINDIYNGKKLEAVINDNDVEYLSSQPLIRIYSQKGEFLAIYRIIHFLQGNTCLLKPEKVFPLRGGTND